MVNEDNAVQPENEKIDTLTGRYMITGNPCTTRPCLPGVAYAILVNDEHYFITLNGHWFSENRSWEGYTPEPGNMVTVAGSAEEKIDIYGKPFHTIEAVSVYPA